MAISFRIDIATRNPLNGSRGNSARAAMYRTRQRARERALSEMCTRAAIRWAPITDFFVLPCIVQLTRVAPSNGLDPFDGLPASLKSIVDGIADAMGLKNDRDPQVVWAPPLQRRGKRGEYAVEVEIQTGGSNV
jgi:hypothetical protein